MFIKWQNVTAGRAFAMPAKFGVETQLSTSPITK